MSILGRRGILHTPALSISSIPSTSSNTPKPAMLDRLLNLAIWITAVLLVLALVGVGIYRYQIHYIHGSVTVMDRDALILEDQIRQQPGNADLRVALANLYVEKGYYDDAVAQAEQVLRTSHDNQGALLALAEAQQKKGDLAQATSNFSRVVAVNEGNPMAMSNIQLALAHQSLGSIYMTLGKAADAETELRKSLEIDRGNADTLRLLGDAQTAQGKPDEAIQSYSQAVRLVPDFREAYLGLAQASQAKADAGRVAYAEGMVAMVDGNYSLAVDKLSQAAKALPDASEVHLGLAMTYEKQGQRTLALNEYRDTARLDGTSIVAKQGLGRLGAK